MRSNMIKTMRMRLGYTSAEVANGIGVSLPTYRSWERGTVVNIKADNLVKLADFLDCSTDLLLGRDLPSDEDVPYKAIYRSLDPEHQRILDSIALAYRSMELSKESLKDARTLHNAENDEKEQQQISRSSIGSVNVKGGRNVDSPTTINNTISY